MEKIFQKFFNKVDSNSTNINASHNTKLRHLKKTISTQSDVNQRNITGEFS